jgi:hypothetical protein
MDPATGEYHVLVGDAQGFISDYNISKVLTKLKVQEISPSAFPQIKVRYNPRRRICRDFTNVTFTKTNNDELSSKEEGPLHLISENDERDQEKVRPFHSK